MEPPKEFSPEWFDWSSQMWLANKQKRANATYVYTCSKRLGDDTKCPRPVYKKTGYCWNHRSEVKVNS